MVIGCFIDYKLFLQLVDSLNWRIQNEIDSVLEVSDSSVLLDYNNDLIIIMVVVIIITTM